MKVYMLKDVENLGIAGQVVNVKTGYATNYLIPYKFAKQVFKKAEGFFAERAKKANVAAEVLNNKVAMLGERIKNMKLSIKKRQHDDGKLYGSISAEEIVDLLKAKDVTISKKQVVFKKAVKTAGEHKVTIKLSSKVTPEASLNVIGTEA